MEEGAFLQLKDIHKGYQLGRTFISVLRGVDLSVERGEWLALLGASGSGKTTLLNIIGALETPERGHISCDGIDYSSMKSKPAAHFRCSKTGFIFQAYHMFHELSVLENVKLPAMINGRWGRKVERDAVDLLTLVGLGHRLEHKPGELSGGEQQRAAIARALINSPALILADEPTGNLDSKTGTEILEIFKKLHDSDLERTIIMVTHDSNVAALADRTVHIKDGKIEEGTESDAV